MSERLCSRCGYYPSVIGISRFDSFAQREVREHLCVQCGRMGGYSTLVDAVVPKKHDEKSTNPFKDEKDQIFRSFLRSHDCY